MIGGVNFTPPRLSVRFCFCGAQRPNWSSESVAVYWEERRFTSRRRTVACLVKLCGDPGPTYSPASSDAGSPAFFLGRFDHHVVTILSPKERANWASPVVFSHHFKSRAPDLRGAGRVR